VGRAVKSEARVVSHISKTGRCGAPGVGEGGGFRALGGEFENGQDLLAGDAELIYQLVYGHVLEECPTRPGPPAIRG